MIKCEPQSFWCCHCGTAAARVHPVHQMDVARSARWPPTFRPNR